MSILMVTPDTIIELLTQRPCASQWVVNRLQNVLQLRGARRTGFLPLSQTNVSQCGGDWWSQQVYNREVRHHTCLLSC